MLSTGLLAEDLADLPRAERMYERATALAHTAGLPELEVECHIAFARLQAARGDLTEALDRKTRALEIAERLGDWHLLARLHVAMGTTLFELQRYDDAMQAYEHGIETARRIGDTRMLAYGLYNAAGAYIRRGDLLQAESRLKECEPLIRKLREPVMEALVLSYYGAIWDKRGKWQLAKRDLLGSVELLRSSGHELDFARTATRAAFSFQKNGEPEAAQQLLEQALAVARRLRATRVIEEAERQLAELAESARLQPSGRSAEDALPYSGT